MAKRLLDNFMIPKAKKQKTDFYEDPMEHDKVMMNTNIEDSPKFNFNLEPRSSGFNFESQTNKFNFESKFSLEYPIKSEKENQLDQNNNIDQINKIKEEIKRVSADIIKLDTKLDKLIESIQKCLNRLENIDKLSHPTSPWTMSYIN